MIYKYRSWGHNTKVPAQVVGDCLENLRVKHNGFMTPRAVVEEARDEKSPLHPAFEWQDDIAAEKFREQQARNVIASIIVYRDELPDKPTKAFVNISFKDDRRYTSIGHAMEDEDLKARVLASAFAEFQTFKKKYQEVEELTEVFDAFDKLNN